MRGRQKSRWRANNADGFTLLELLVVLGIISLVLVSVYAFRVPQSGNFALKVSAHDVAAQLRAARAFAIHKNRESVFSLDIARGLFWSDAKSKKQSLPPRVKTTLVTAQEQIVNAKIGHIRFFANGSSTGGAVVLEYGGRGYAVTTNWLTGQIRVSEHAGAVKLK